jgi:hypothetical protein
VDVDDVTFTFKVGFSKLQFKGKYSIDARLLLLRLAGSGDLTGNFSEISFLSYFNAFPIFVDQTILYLLFHSIAIHHYLLS